MKDRNGSISVGRKSGTSSDPQNDRERIAAAFVELSERGYVFPFPGWAVCCSSCGWAAVRRHFGVTDTDADSDDGIEDRKVVWWHEQSDSLAFAGDSGMVLHTDGFFDQVPEDEAEADEWFDEHADEVMADEVTARTTEYVNLRGTLYLHWLGDADEIVAALRVQGLRAVRPPSDATCITVLPTVTEFDVSTSPMGEVFLSFDDSSTILTPADARRLAKQLNAAAKRAQTEAMPGF